MALCAVGIFLIHSCYTALAEGRKDFNDLSHFPSSLF